MPDAHILIRRDRVFRRRQLETKLGRQMSRQSSVCLRLSFHGPGPGFSSKSGLRVSEEAQMLCDRLGRSRLMRSITIVEKFVEGRLVERYRCPVVTRCCVHSGQQLVHLQCNRVAVTPDLAQVVTDVSAQSDGCVDMTTTVAGFHKATADPNDDVQCPCPLNDTRSPKVGQDNLAIRSASVTKGI